MANTKEGGKQTGNTNKRKYDAMYLKKYGMTYYQYIGTKGGSKKGYELDSPKGFGANKELAREAGRKGGLVSRRK